MFFGTDTDVRLSVQAYRKFTDMSREQIITRMKDDLSGGAKQSYYLTVNRDKRYDEIFARSESELVQKRLTTHKYM